MPTSLQLSVHLLSLKLSPTPPTSQHWSQALPDPIPNKQQIFKPVLKFSPAEHLPPPKNNSHWVTHLIPKLREHDNRLHVEVWLLCRGRVKRTECYRRMDKCWTSKGRDGFEFSIVCLCICHHAWDRAPSHTLTFPSGWYCILRLLWINIFPTSEQKSSTCLSQLLRYFHDNGCAVSLSTYRAAPTSHPHRNQQPKSKIIRSNQLHPEKSAQNWSLHRLKAEIRWTWTLDRAQLVRPQHYLHPEKGDIWMWERSSIGHELCCSCFVFEHSIPSNLVDHW